MLTEADKQYWQSIEAGVFTLQRCTLCESVTFPPSGVCRSCLSPALRWDEVNPKGIVWSWVRFHKKYLADFPLEPPYVVALVELDEGPRMMMSLLGNISDPRCGARGQVEMAVLGDRTLPHFRVDAS